MQDDLHELAGQNWSVVGLCSQESYEAYTLHYVCLFSKIHLGVKSISVQ